MAQMESKVAKEFYADDDLQYTTQPWIEINGRNYFLILNDTIVFYNRQYNEKYKIIKLLEIMN